MVLCANKCDISSGSDLDENVLDEMAVIMQEFKVLLHLKYCLFVAKPDLGDRILHTMQC